LRGYFEPLSCSHSEYVVIFFFVLDLLEHSNRFRFDNFAEGLKLESAKLPVEVLVIHRVEKPSEN